MDAYAKTTTSEEERDRRGTPVEIFDCISRHFNVFFDLDACADSGNNKLANYYTIDDDALTVQFWNGTYCWMNPPYSAPYDWCKKAAEQAQLGRIVVGLLPDDRSTKWYKEQCYPKASAIYTTSRRIPFLDENGVPQNGNPKGGIAFRCHRMGPK